MRICFLADAGSVNTRNWVDHLADAHGHDVHVVTVRRTGTFSERVTLHRIGEDRGTTSVRGKFSYLTAPRRVRRILKEIAPDIVVGYRVASYGYLAYRSGFRPFVVAAQGQRIVCPPGASVKQVLVRRVLGQADLITSWAPHMSARLVELGAPPERILTCPRGIDLTRFSSRVTTNGGPLSVISTRGLNRHYRTDVLIEAFALVRGERPDAVMTVAGLGEAEDELRTLANERGVGDAVRFVGALDPDRLAGLLRESSFYASAVPTDGVSASLMEAMASGAFPVVTANDANRHWIEDGKNGSLIPRPEPRAYADAILSAAGDAELVSSAVRQNREIVEERADIVKNVAHILSVYQRVAAGERVTPGGTGA